MDIIATIITWAIVIGIVSLVEYFVVKAAVNSALDEYSKRRKEEYGYMISQIRDIINRQKSNND